VNVNERLAALAGMALPPQQWRSGCRAAGIDTLEIALPTNPLAAPVAAPAPAPAEASDPLGEKSGGNSLFGKQIPASAFFAIVVSLLAVLAIFTFGRTLDFGAGTPDSGGSREDSSETWADGKSNIPGGELKISYAPSGHDWEVSEPTSSGEATWWLVQAFPSTQADYGVEINHFRQPLTTQALIDQWVADEDALETKREGRTVGHSKIRVGGRTAYSWELNPAPGDWQRSVWVFGPDHAYRFICDTEAPSAGDLVKIKKRCAAFLRSAKFATKS
jgi:hypothetical protein